MTWLSIILASTFLASSIRLTDGAPEYGKSYGNVEEGERRNVTGMIVYQDGEVVTFVLNGGDPVSSAVVTRFDFKSGSVSVDNNFALLSMLQQSYAGENGITIKDDGHYIFLFPGGYSGQRVVHVFNCSDHSSSTIEVYCLPISLLYRPAGRQIAEDRIVGHCTSLSVLNTMHISEYQYFKLGVRNGKWMDISHDKLNNSMDTCMPICIWESIEILG